MKVLWLCLFLPKQVADKMNMEGSVKEGWITGALNRMMQGDNDVSLAIAYPVADRESEQRTDVMLTETMQVPVYSFYEDIKKPEDYCLSMSARFLEIIEDYKPDVVHVFGTEYPHTLAMARTVKSLSLDKGEAPRLLIGLQGIIHKCGEVYTADVPSEITHAYTFRDILKKDNIAAARAKFLERGEYEKEALTLADNVTGRTSFDMSVSKKFNPNVRYFHMNETLREEFYSGTWDLNECNRHTIFVSQGDYPLKGLHTVLEAMPGILDRYPDARVFVAGNNVAKRDTLKSKIKLSTYGKYLNSIMDTYHLQDKVTFLGRLDVTQMKEQYLMCHTYVCASSIENSPNSMGEAMLLGVPVVATRTGGIPDMINDEEEGLLFEVGNTSGLADDVCSIWDDDAKALSLSAAALNRACFTHDADRNYNRLMEIYGELCK